MGLVESKINKPSQAAILCGGIGSRLMPHTLDTPKPMILCNGKPFLWYLLDNLNKQGISHFVLMTGYLSEKIQSYFKDGSLWGWKIEYSDGPVEWDTGRRLWEAKELLNERFMLMYSDNFALFSLDELLILHLKNNVSLTFIVTLKSPGNIKRDDNGIVIKYDNNRTSSDLDYVEIGYMIVEKFKVLSFYESSDCSFSSILEKMSKSKQISSFIKHDSYYSISDPMRWKKTEKYLNSEKIIFIDRDGVINHKAPRGEYISRWEDFKFIQESFESMKKLSQKGFKFIVITNQAGIARGMIEKSSLEFIHKKMKDEFQKAGIKILEVFICPHHWDDGCFCRKPNPGMFYKASKKYLIRLDQTVFIGDDSRDCQAAEKAGCQSIFIGNSDDLKHLSIDQMPIFQSLSMIDSIDSIINFYSEIPKSKIV
jgi:histidinol-phosphate phosphatase family protein